MEVQFLHSHLKLNNMGSKGLGDTIAKITKATGIDKVVEAIVEDCGCKERQEKLNKLFPYKKNNNGTFK